jgi:hypothetical protein
MSTLNLGLEELVARQRHEEVERSVRYAWHWADFRRSVSRAEQLAVHRPQPSWRGELVEWGMTCARLAML